VGAPNLVRSTPIAMKRGGIARLALVLATAAVLVIASAPPAFASGAGGATGSPCTPTAGGSVGATNPVPIAANASVSCPMVSGPTGTPYGPGQSRGSPPGGPPGQPCQYVVEQPSKVQVTGPNSAVQMDADYTGTRYGSFSYPSYMALYPVQVAAKYDVFTPYLFTGKYDANGRCTVPVGGNIAPGWQLGCPNPYAFYNIVIAGNLCSTQYPNAVARPNGLNPGAIIPFLNQANLLQFINLGKLSSLPNNPNAGLVNIGTCYFIVGATFTTPGGPPQSVQKPATYEMTISEPVNDGTGRYVWYVFRIQVAFQGPTWDFGDNSTVEDPQLPGPCTGVTADVAVSHTYSRYGTFQVSVTEHYVVTVDEYWSDSNTQYHLTLNNLIPPINRTLGPYTKTVLQEVGIPVHG